MPLKTYGDPSGLRLLWCLLALVLCAGAAAGPSTVVYRLRAADGVYPFSARLTFHGERTGSRPMACSGALIAPAWVLTAGHCFRDSHGFRVSGPPPLATSVLIGRTDIGRTGGFEPTVREVHQSLINDVALAHLSTPVPSVPPVPLQGRPPVPGLRLVLAGWGATDTARSAPADHLMLGTVAVTAVAAAEAGVHGVAPSPATSACRFDSGAPYLDTSDARRPVLVAVEGHGPPCPHASTETTSRVDILLPWLTAQLGADRSSLQVAS